MAIDKETQVSASVVLDKNIYEELKEICKKEKRSVSSQVALLVEDYVKTKSKTNK